MSLIDAVFIIVPLFLIGVALYYGAWRPWYWSLPRSKGRQCNRMAHLIADGCLWRPFSFGHEDDKGNISLIKFVRPFVAQLVSAKVWT